ncbi:hypothetical protein [Terrisporobacter mayombei]|uniref:Resolvase/invertase-type recombinase catalytic domain-containing protein n=1 Tax=Terrisporobacter mayombei TaxID=1541 RepID=A0ABY9Q0S2_9FIRM|nr:hypothetical protein [Terrisporobacter mayombei]MCC3868466.1 hypothetical protein [Terrisporobacter mayombei]WMT80620.1 hypothetical protein TEMA_09410 [Terrisporobacter mayombei]
MKSMLVKIKSDSTKEVTRYKTDRDITKELKHLEDKGVNIIQMRYFDETQSFGNCQKLIVISE